MLVRSQNKIDRRIWQSAERHNRPAGVGASETIESGLEDGSPASATGQRDPAYLLMVTHVLRLGVITDLFGHSAFIFPDKGASVTVGIILLRAPAVILDMIH